MSDYSKLAAKRYRQYLWQEQKVSFIHRLAILVLRILEAFVRKLQEAGITKTRRVQKINVEEE
jgi:hypothetical protein